jgi:hypothetical protein
MRSREAIERDTKPFEALSLEVLLDIRDSLKPPKPAKKRMGRPKGSKNKKKE